MKMSLLKDQEPIVACENAVNIQAHCSSDPPLESLLPSLTERNGIFSSPEADSIFAAFDLPQFSTVLKEKLDTGKMLNEEDKQQVVLELGIAIRNFTHYPTMTQLCSVVLKFLAKYHYLRGINCDVQGFWVNKLLEEFVQFGIRAAKMKKNESHEDTSRKKKDQASQFHYYEDLTLVIEKMKQDYVDPKGNKTRIPDLMRLTFQTRRNFINFEMPKISTLREIYPALFNVNEVKADFWRLTGRNSADVFRKNLKQYSSIVYDLRQADPDLKSLILFSKRKKEFDMRIIPILLLPSVLGERLSFLYFNNEGFNKEMLQPWINCSSTLSEMVEGIGSYSIYAETVKICQIDNLVDAMECYIACFFTFDIEYNPECFKTLQILQHFFMEVEEDVDKRGRLKQEVIKLIKILRTEYKKQITAIRTSEKFYS